MRVPGVATELLEIDRNCERIAATRAADLGFAPEVVGVFDGCLVTRFVPGGPITAADFEDPTTLEPIAAMVRAFHRSGPLPHTFDAFAVPRLHRRAATDRGVAIPSSFERMDVIVQDIAAVFATSPDGVTPSHNDLLRANFLRDGARIWLLDWEYAGMNQPTFDLGNLAVNNALSPDAERSLVEAYFGAASERNSARVRLMKIVSDAREAMWGVVQQGISTIDFDYRAYADEHFDRLLTNASKPAYPTWLAQAAEYP